MCFGSKSAVGLYALSLHVSRWEFLFAGAMGKVEIKGMVMSAIHRFSVDWMEIDPP